MPELELPFKKVEYRVKFSKKRKTVGITVDKANGLSVSAPVGTPMYKIDEILVKHKEWISRKIHWFSEVLQPPPPKEFVSGERFPYIGRMYRLQVEKVEKSSIRLQFIRGQFVVSTPKNREHSPEKIRNEFIKWYRQKALEKIQSRVDFYAPKIGEWPTRIRIKTFRARWGSCQPDNTIDFNWKIVMAPMSIIDYIVVHELCHLVVKNHSKTFWNKLATIIVDHKERKEWLRINGTQLTI